MNQSADPVPPADPATSADQVRDGADLAPGGADQAPDDADPTARADMTQNDGPTTAAEPNDGAPRRRKPRRAVRRGTEREAVLGVSVDERPAGWGEGVDGGGAAEAGHTSNDEQLRRDVPPHWG